MTDVCRFRIRPEVSLKDIEKTLMATWGIYVMIFNETDFPWETDHYLRAENVSLVFDVSTDVGLRLSKIFAAELAESFGKDCFQVEGSSSTSVSPDLAST